MANKLNLIALKRGDVVRMSDGAVAQITENPGDGIWVYGFYLQPGQDAADQGVDEPIFAQDIEDLVSEAD